MAKDLELGVTEPLGVFDPLGWIETKPEAFEQRRAIDRKHKWCNWSKNTNYVLLGTYLHLEMDKVSSRKNKMRGEEVSCNSNVVN